MSAGTMTARLGRLNGELKTFGWMAVVFGLAYFLRASVGLARLSATAITARVIEHDQLGLAYGVIAGMALYVLVHLPGLWRYGVRWHPVFDWQSPEVRQVIWLTLPRMAGVMDRVTVVRSVTHPYPLHCVAYTTSGIPDYDVSLETRPRDPRHWPYIGSVVDYVDRRRAGGAASRGTKPSTRFLRF